MHEFCNIFFKYGSAAGSVGLVHFSVRILDAKKFNILTKFPCVFQKLCIPFRLFASTFWCVKIQDFSDITSWDEEFRRCLVGHQPDPKGGDVCW